MSPGDSDVGEPYVGDSAPHHSSTLPGPGHRLKHQVIPWWQPFLTPLTPRLTSTEPVGTPALPTALGLHPHHLKSGVRCDTWHLSNTVVRCQVKVEAPGGTSQPGEGVPRHLKPGEESGDHLSVIFLLYLTSSLHLPIPL